MYINVFYLCLLWLLRAIFFYIPKFWDLPQNLGIFLGFPGIFLGCQVMYSKNSQSFWDVFKYLGWLGIAPKKSQNSGIIPKTSQKIPNSWDHLWDDPRILGRKAQVPFKPATFHNSASIDTTRLCAPNSVANIGQWSKPAPLNVSWIWKAAAQQWSIQLSSQAAFRNWTRTTLLIQESSHSPWLPLDTHGPCRGFVPRRMGPGWRRSIPLLSLSA